MRHHISLAVATIALVLPGVSHAQSAQHVELRLEVDPCVQVDARFARRIIDIELGTATPPPDASGSVLARVTCAGSMQLLRVDDAVTGKALERTIDLHGAEPAARTRLLALAVAELVAASWAELEVTPAPRVPPVPPPATREVQESAREALRARAQAPAPEETASEVAPAPVRRVRRVPPSPPPMSGLDGSIGLLHVATAEMPRRMALRGSLFGSYASEDRIRSSALGVVAPTSRFALDANAAFSPLRHLEFFAGLRWVVTSPNVPESDVVIASSSFVDGLRFGASGAFSPTLWLSLGATAAALPRSGPSGFVAAATSALFRTQATLDLSRFTSSLPLRLHANLGYRLDNSGASVAELEQQRRMFTRGYDPAICAQAPSADPMNPRNVGPTGIACNQEITRYERYGFSVNRVDRVEVAFAIDLWIPSFPYLRPFVEYATAVPVARSGYVCFDARLHAADTDRCLASSNLAGNPVPSQVTLGTRATLPFAANLSALVAVDIATGGTSTFVRELAPTTPWTLHFALGIAPEFGPLPTRRRSAAPSPDPQPAEPAS